MRELRRIASISVAVTELLLATVLDGYRARGLRGETTVDHVRDQLDTIFTLFRNKMKQVARV